ncbi:DNA-processing protein DprA [Aureitalea marina]|uniref:DNA protecting protein DprA n=1 Tax=Aureitalea marina TaxID=930804 RepID=A0A2S7KSC3_9FLAO|nr:DNA-processing protein DprA [Aureitalea marina]PQB05520.1 DNA protecting protein DprA [Aureitalea marina]
MINTDELRATLALQSISGISTILARKLLTHYGTALEIWDKIPRNEGLPNGISPKLVEKFINKSPLDRADMTLEKTINSGDQMLHWQDVNYPNHLRQCIDAPLLLFARGSYRFDHRPVISIVGTRECSAYGENFLDSFVSGLTSHNPLIVSGFAKGIDIYAHLTALDHGLDTVACLGHGFDKIYPVAHKVHQDRLVNSGLFLTEYSRGSSVLPMNFVSRNRIIAGLSEVTVVIQSAQTGGSLITASLANSYNREVMALPGRIDDPKSAGCNNLIKQNKAAVLTSAQDLIRLMGWEEKESRPKPQIDLSLTDPDQRQIADFLVDHPKAHIDQIMTATSMKSQRLQVVLLEMEMTGLVKALPSRMFSLT